jgi:hypothetical protein
MNRGTLTPNQTRQLNNSMKNLGGNFKPAVQANAQMNLAANQAAMGNMAGATKNANAATANLKKTINGMRQEVNTIAKVANNANTNILRAKLQAAVREGNKSIKAFEMAAIATGMAHAAKFAKNVGSTLAASAANNAANSAKMVTGG